MKANFQPYFLLFPNSDSTTISQMDTDHFPISIFQFFIIILYFHFIISYTPPWLPIFPGNSSFFMIFLFMFRPPWVTQHLAYPFKNTCLLTNWVMDSERQEQCKGIYFPSGTQDSAKCSFNIRYRWQGTVYHTTEDTFSTFTFENHSSLW